MECDSTDLIDTIKLTIFNYDSVKDFYIPITEISRIFIRDWEYGLDIFAPLTPKKVIKILYGQVDTLNCDIVIYDNEHLEIFIEKMLICHFLQNGQKFKMDTSMNPGAFHRAYQKAKVYLDLLADA